MCAVVLFSFIHICIGVVDSIVNGGKGMPNTGSTTLHFCGCPKPRLDFQHHMAWYFLCSKIWGERWLFVLLI